MIGFFFFFFFFQAEDGIRDPLVTGVQTCALPICSRRSGIRGARIDGRPPGTPVISHDVAYRTLRHILFTRWPGGVHAGSPAATRVRPNLGAPDHVDVSTSRHPGEPCAKSSVPISPTSAGPW